MNQYDYEQANGTKQEDAQQKRQQRTQMLKWTSPASKDTEKFLHNTRKNPTTGKYHELKMTDYGAK